MNKRTLLAIAALSVTCKARAPTPPTIQGSISFQVEGMRRINGAL